MGGRRPQARMMTATGAVPRRVLVLRCPDLLDPGITGRDQRPAPARAWLFERVVAAATEFCPQVEAVEPGVCAFGVDGPARYFGGETALAGKIVDAMTGLGVTCHVGVAEGLFAAQLAARGSAVPASGSAGPVSIVPPGQTPLFLARQAIGVLADAELAGLLLRLGLNTLGDLAALRATDVATRFGGGERPPTGSRAVLSRGRSRAARQPPTCRSPRNSTRRTPWPNQ